MILCRECNFDKKGRLKDRCFRWTKVHFRHLLCCAFRRGQKVAETVWDVCLVCDNDLIVKKIAQKWFAKF